MDRELSYLDPGLIKTYDWRVERANKSTWDEVDVQHKRYQKMVALLPLLLESGMDIIAGTDAGFLNSYIFPRQGCLGVSRSRTSTKSQRNEIIPKVLCGFP